MHLYILQLQLDI